jgi:hypothetical protein
MREKELAPLRKEIEKRPDVGLNELHAAIKPRI